MKLSRHQKDMGDGKYGEAKQRAMHRLIKFGEAVDAEEMVSVTSAHILGPDFTMGKIPKYDYGTGPIYKEFAALNAEVSVLTTTDPCAMQADRFSDTGYPWNYRNAPFPVECRDGILEGSALLDRMGIINCFSCIPYLSLNIPKFNEYYACCESNASCYANSMCGAKTNRESSITAFYAAITGVLPKYGLLCEEKRKGQILFALEDDVKQSLKFISDWNALGAFVGTTAYDKIPVIANLPKMISIEQAKALSATASPALHFPKMNMVGISPDSPSIEAAFGGVIPKGIEKIGVTLKQINKVYEGLNSAENDDVDIVVSGCPFLTFNEVREIAGKLSGKRIHENVAFWLQTDIPTYLVAKFFGLVDVIERTGAKIYHDTCMGNGPAEAWGSVNIATDSFKNIKLFAGRGQRFHFGGLDDLIRAGVSGKFTSTRKWRVS